MRLVSDPVKEIPENSFTPPTTWGHKEKVAFWKKSSADIASASILILDFLYSGTLRNKFMLFIRYLIHDIWLYQPKWTKTIRKFIFLYFVTEKPRTPEKLLFVFLANSHSTLYLLPLYNNAFINMYENKCISSKLEIQEMESTEKC